MKKDVFFEATILIIDDQKLHHKFLQKVLEKGGFHNIICIGDPLQALHEVQRSSPDLIILDILMPKLDGFQLMGQLQDYRHKHYLPILAISAETNPEFRLKVLRSGATDFLTKPFENSEVLFRIRNMLEMRRLHVAVEDKKKDLEMAVAERTRELQESQTEIIRRLAQAAEFRDNETGEHIVRMSYYCERIGRAMGLNDEECELLLAASPLHDIGKIGIPDHILLKPGKLSAGEFEIMKTHPILGAQLLAGSSSPVMQCARMIAMTHHERWDGTGYPEGLKGDEIPLMGQICSIADVFDALMSSRIYKKAWSTEDAVQEILKMKGIQFNPSLVDAFERVFPDLMEIRKKYEDKNSQ